MRNKLLILLLFFSNCSFEERENTEITFWGLGAEGEYVQKIIPEFEEQNPEIQVKVQMVPWTAAQEKFISAYASDNLPDAFQLGNTWIPQFQSLFALEDLNKFINKSYVVKSNNYFKGIWETNIIDSVVYGIPWYIDTRLLYYRSDIMKQAGYKTPPKTWNELYNASKKIKKLLNDKNKYPIYIPINDWSPYIIFGMQNGASILKENNCYGNFSSNKFEEAFKYLTKYHKEKLSPIGISQVPNVYQAFRDKYITMYISGPWNIKEFQKWMGDSLQNCWDTAPLPSNNGEYPGLSLAGGSSIVLNKKSHNKKEAWKLIEFLSQKEIQLKFYKLLNDLPAVKDTWHDSLFVNDKYVKAFYEQFKNVRATPKIPEWEQMFFS